LLKSVLLPEAKSSVSPGFAMGNYCSSDSRSPDGGLDTAQVSVNRAFVFVKPHAQTERVRELTRKLLAERNIQVDSEGEITGAVIDAKKLIDQHYYAIASKATLLEPSQLPVPSAKFKEKFGETWEEALATQKAANALQACKAFGITASELATKWRECEKAGDLVKFGGGFYCGKMTVGGKVLYVFNAFFMAMRSKFTAPGASIYYFSVSWDPKVLSWADFRGQVLGPTDPAAAPLGSVRRSILESWQELGLAAPPDNGDNGVHASASPFEGLAERMNWLERPMEEDPFGKMLLDRGLGQARLAAWAKDAQVVLESKQKGSIFDALEDMDVEPCLAKLVTLNAGNARNRAFVFVKPHAQTPKVRELVRKRLAESAISVEAEGEIAGSTIDSKQLIDNHYYAIASKATLLEPSQLPVPADKFKEKFGETWEQALAGQKAANAVQACKAFGISATELAEKWRESEKAGDIVKFGGGFYCGKMTVGGKSLYVFNAFFMAMRSKFTPADASIYYYSVSWEPQALSWADFRGKVLGPTDPASAPQGAIRRTIFDQWKELGLKTAPDNGDNGVHASASPFEALAERMNWLEMAMEDDPFGKALLARGLPKARIETWAKDAQVLLESKQNGSIFDALEDMDVEPCLAKLEVLNSANVS